MDVAAGDEDVERLRRVAYGPGAGAAERAEAEAALQALEGRRRDAGAVVAAEPIEDVDVLAPHEGSEIARGVADGGDAGEVGAPIWERRIQVGWVVPVVVVALVVGVLGTLQVTGQLGPKSPPEGPGTIAPTDPPAEGWIQMPGDLHAADAWFDGPATASDAYPFGALLESNGIDPYEVRFALAGGSGWNVWVGRSGTGELCLLIADASDQSGAAGCVERVQFARGGMHLGLNGRTADWFGDEVMTPESWAGRGETLAPPGEGPGDVEAANEWFATPGAERDAYPNPEILEEIGVATADIRVVELGQGQNRALWVARQGTSGFCLLMTDDVARTSNYACAPIDAFRASGVSVATEGFAAYWNGESLLTTD